MSNANYLSRNANQLFDANIPISVSSLSVGTIQQGGIAPIEVKSDLFFTPVGIRGVGGCGAVETAGLFSLSSQVASLQSADISFFGDVQVLGGVEVSGSVIHSGDLDVLGQLSVVGDISAGSDLRLDGDAHILGDISCDGTLAVGSTSAMGGNVSVAGSLTASRYNSNDISLSLLVGGGASSSDFRGIAINTGSGASVGHSGAIVINTGNPAVSSTASGFFVVPVRGVALGKGVGVMVYDPTTKEIQYSTD